MTMAAKNILVFGDSIAWGAWDSEGGWAARLRKGLDAHAIAQGFDAQPKRYVYGLGIPGDDTRSIRARFDAEMSARVDDGEATVIMLAVGVNDSQYEIATREHRTLPNEFRDNLVALFAQSRGTASHCACVGLLPVEDEKLNPMPWKPSHAYALEYVQQYDALVRESCAEEGVAYIPLMEEFMQGTWQQLLVDGIHPNSEGHALIAEILQRELLSLGML